MTKPKAPDTDHGARGVGSMRPALGRATRMVALVLACSGPWQPTVAQPSPLIQSDNEHFTLNFKDADLTALIATVSEITGRNFVVDPRVKARVTVLSAHPMSPEDLYETFLSVLEVHGFAAVPAGDVIKIVPQVNAKESASFGRDITTQEDIVTQVIQVDNVPAAQLVPILRPLVPQYGHLAAYPASNILIISDRKANVERLAKIVERIDREGNRKVERIPLEFANSADVVEILNQLKTNAAQGAPEAADFSALADTRTNSVVIAGDPANRLRLRAIIADLDTQVERDGGTQVIYLAHADAESIAKALESFTKPAAPAQAATAETISIIAEPGANALVVTAPADTMREIRRVIEQLDIRRGQVLVEAIIAEVSMDRSRELGIDTAVFDQDGLVAGAILDADTLKAIPALAANGTPLGLIQQGLNLAFGDINKQGTSFALLLKALTGDSETNVLSTPSLVTRDNEEAKIMVGQVVPFITGAFTSPVSGGQSTNVNPFQTVERRDVGLSLTITPQINAGDTILMDIALEVSSIAQGATGAVDLITNQRTLTTSVEIRSGQILVLGGLIDDQLSVSEQEVPLLGDIPLLGALFSSTSVQHAKRNLLNFIRPTILREDAVGYYTRDKYNHMRDLQRSKQATPIPLMPDEERPLLPPIERYQHTPVLPQPPATGEDKGFR